MPKQVTRWECEFCSKLHETEEDALDCCQPSQDKIRTEYCTGCHNDFYNHGDKSTTGKCWSLDSARIIWRKEVHVNQRPPWMQAPKLLPNCFKREQHVYMRGDQTTWD